MEKFRILSANNMKKNIGQYVSFALILVLASILLNLGILVQMNFGDSFSQKWKQYNASDVFVTMAASDYKHTYLKKIKSIDGIKSVEKRECILMPGTYTFSGSTMDMPNIFFNMDDSNKISKLGIMEKSKATYSNSAYVSYYLKYAGYKLGDTYTFTSNRKKYTFTIAGFVEDMIYGTQSLSMVGIYLPNKSFDALKNLAGKKYLAANITCKVDDIKSCKKISSKLAVMLNEDLSGVSVHKIGYYDECKQLRTMTANMGGMIFVIFSFIILLVSILVSNFRINNNIQEEMQNMGVLKSLGYTGKQIIVSIVSPYIFISLTASLSGAGLSYFLLPLLEDGFAAQTGIRWEQGFDLSAFIITILVIVLLIASAAYLSTAKIKRLQPIMALRGGIKTHNFRRNYFPLEKTIGTANFIIALKNLIANGRQNILLFIVIIASTLSAIFAGTMYYNINVNPDAFTYAVVETMPSVSFEISKDSIRNELKKDKNVKDAFYYDSPSVLVDNENVKAFVTADFSKMDNNICYEGSNPVHDNEIAIGNAVSEQSGIKIGDDITISYKKEKVKYLVTGLIQSANEQGNCLEMTTKAFYKLNPHFKPSNLNVYLKNEEHTARYIKETKKIYGADIISSIDYIKSTKGALKMFNTIAALLCIVIALITTALITLILYMLIKTVILRRKTDIGIAKSLGYTTTQLKLQIALSLLPVVIAGTIIGNLLGGIFMNSFLGMLFRMTGVMKLDFTIPVMMLIGIGIATSMAAFIISLMISNRIKHVSAYSLIKE